MKVATETFAWIVIVLVGLIGLAIVFQIFRGKINLTMLISESDGKGSMSRLQFLIFTFVVAGSFFLITISSNPPKFPSKIPGEVLALLGISGGSYVLGKGSYSAWDTTTGSPARYALPGRSTGFRHCSATAPAAVLWRTRAMGDA